MIEVREDRRFFAPLVMYVVLLVFLLCAAAVLGPMVFSSPTGETAYAESGEVGPRAGAEERTSSVSFREPCPTPVDQGIQSRSAGVI